MRATIINLSKRITVPKLSPSHTSARIIRFMLPSNPDLYVESYDPVMILECSSDLIADPADRDYPEQKPLMFIETMDEGNLKNLDDHDGKWIPVGTPIGTVDDGDVLDGDWTWQAYLHSENEENAESK